MREIKLPECIAIISLLHLVCAATVVATYSAGFGAGIYSLLTVSDIGNVALSAMPLIYAYILIFVIIFVAKPKRWEIPADDPPPPYGAQNVVSAILIICIGGALTAFLVFKQKNPALGLVGYGPLGISLAGVTIIWIKRKFIWPHLYFEVAMILASLLACCAAYGAGHGRNDRFSIYANVIRLKPKVCGNLGLLSRISDMYLVVRPTGTKALVKGDCDVFAEIPEPLGLPQ